ncbi:MAG TPA: hypothetical protein ENI73_11060 [Spirochaetes bacterium]|nr:hypothetical protein [Spirochaetota bacterium]
MSNLLTLKKELEKGGINLCYCGPISYDVLEAIGKNIRERLEKEEKNQYVGKKVFGLFVEAVQNIKDYSDEIMAEETQVTSLKSGIITIGKKDNKFFIETGNIVNNEKKDSLVEQIKKLNSMTKEELKVLYKIERQKPIDESTGRGGLGLIDIARKSSEKLEYDITAIDSQNSFYLLRISI